MVSFNSAELNGRANKNRNRDKKRGGAIDLLTPFTATNDNDLKSSTTVRPGRKRQPGPKHLPKPGPSFVPAHERNRYGLFSSFQRTSNNRQ